MSTDPTLQGAILNPKSTNSDLEILGEKLSRMKVTPFVGAGLSMNVGLPSWANVISEMKTELECTSDKSYLEIAQDYENKFGRKGLLALLNRLLGLDAVDFSRLDVHHVFLDLPFQEIFTTNQDMVLEAALATTHIPHESIKTLADLRQAKPQSVKRIIKFHGDIESPDEIVFTQNDYERRMRELHWQDIYLAGRLIENCVLFIGYSLRDENVLLVWKRILKFSSPTFTPEAFRLLHVEDKEEIERMDDLGIKSIILPIRNYENPEELIEWLSKIRQDIGLKSFQALDDYLAHGRVMPGYTLTKGVLDSVEKQLLENGNAQKILHSYVFSRTVPIEMRERVETILCEHASNLIGEAWVFKLAQRYQMDNFLLDLFKNVDIRDAEFDGIGRNPFQNLFHDFDEWTFKFLIQYLNQVDPKRNRDDPKFHIVDIFDCLRNIDFSEYPNINSEAINTFEETKKSYFAKFKVIEARWGSSGSFRVPSKNKIAKDMMDSIINSRNRNKD